MSRSIYDYGRFEDYPYQSKSCTCSNLKNTLSNKGNNVGSSEVLAISSKLFFSCFKQSCYNQFMLIGSKESECFTTSNMRNGVGMKGSQFDGCKLGYKRNEQAP